MFTMLFFDSYPIEDILGQSEEFRFSNIELIAFSRFIKERKEENEQKSQGMLEMNSQGRVKSWQSITPIFNMKFPESKKFSLP